MRRRQVHPIKSRRERIINQTEPNEGEQRTYTLSRRVFATAAMGLVAAGVATQWGADWLEAFLANNFRELSATDIDELLKRVEREVKEKFNKTTCHVSATPAQDGVEFGYGLDLARCIGCRRCVYACVKENNLSRKPQVHWIRVLEMEKERGVDLFDANAYYKHKEVPDEKHFYMPVQCHQCRQPPCTKTCPTGATWTEPDGITVVDQDWCIGCRCCMAACPYGARHFNWADPQIPDEELNTEIHVLGNRPRKRGVVGKCTFCIQRVREGKYPACVEICPTGARKFGNLLDPQSEIRYIMANKRVFIFKEEVATRPRFYYFYA